MGGRDHSCEVCGRGGFNDPEGECVCPECGEAEVFHIGGSAGRKCLACGAVNLPSVSHGADRALRESLMEALRAVPRNSDTPYYLALADAALAVIEAQRERD